MQVVTIAGARPQFIKAAPLSVALRKEHDELLVHTGQHYDENMSDVFFRELGIPSPDIHLGVGSGSHGTQTAAMLTGIERVLLEQPPDAVIVYGDTNSTLAGTLAAAKLHIPVAHVEAGLRSFNREMPEEINRILTDHVATWLFAPTRAAVDHLAREGISEGVWHVGDIMVDSLRLFAPRAKEHSRLLERLHARPKEYCVATVHRASNTDCAATLARIVDGLRRLPLPVVFPMHPRTRAALGRYGIDVESSIPPKASPQPGRITVIEPLGYLDMVQLQQHAAVILTDSGGMQKEAYLLGVPCVTLRRETEWTELVDIGANRLCPPDSAVTIVDTVRDLLQNHARPTEMPTLYGDGHTAERIVSALVTE